MLNRLPRLVALDLDGTLLNPAKELTPRTRAAVRALADAGTVCVLASGRMYRDCMAPQVAALGLDSPVICYNGAVILNPVSGEILSEKPVSPARVEPLMEYAVEQDLTLNLYHGDRLYCRQETDWTRLYVARTGARPIYREDLFDWFRGKASTKCLLLDHPPRVEERLAIWRERCGHELYVTISDPEYLEFMNPTATKGWALRSLCEHLAIDVADTAAFGDARNDLPLIEAAGYGVAMANARPELREAADLIARSNEDDGVAQVIEGWLREFG